MTALIPPSFLMRFQFSLRHIAEIPRTGNSGRQKKGRVWPLELSQACQLPFPSALNGERPWADMRMAWNANGIGVSCLVQGKSLPLVGFPGQRGDGVEWVFDLRPAPRTGGQAMHRAGRFCVGFFLSAVGGGTDGQLPLAVPQSIGQAREASPLCDEADLLHSAEITRDGYRLETWFPATVLPGFDPASQPLIGCNYRLTDSELGNQSWTLDHRFPALSDPTLWPLGELKE